MICAPIKQKTITSLLRDFKEAQKKCDIVEIWLDEILLTEKDLKKIFKLKKKPLIYKLTTRKNLHKLKEHKIDFFDVEYKNANKNISEIKKTHPESKIIISHHNYKKTPSLRELQNKLSKIKKLNPDIIKIATFAKTFGDSLKILEFMNKNSKKHKLIAVCMGEKGKITRVAGHLVGNYLMYAPLREKDKTAPGQISISELKEIRCLLK